MTPQNISKFSSEKKKDPILRSYRLYTKKADIKGIKVKTDKSQHPFITKTQKIRIE